MPTAVARLAPSTQRRALLLLAALLSLLPLAVSAETLDAADTATLRAHVGQPVEIRGTPTASGQSKTGTVGYLNFAPAHQGVSLVFFFKPGQAGSAGTIDDLKLYVGKTIIVSGQLADYKGDLQIKVESLDQIKPVP